MRRLILVLAGFAALALLPGAAQARPDAKGRPFARGTLQPSLGLGANLGGDLSVVSIGLGARYFVVNGLGPGLTLNDTILIYGDKLRANFPGIASQTPTNIVRVMPNLQWVFVRTRWFSPYVIGGVGPSFYNHGGGTVGEWMAGGGAFIGLGGPVFVDLGVGFSGVFPQSKCEDAFLYEGPAASGQVIDACSFTWGPRLGLTIAFGVGGNDDKGSRRERRRQQAAPASPSPEPERAWEPPPAPEEPEPTPTPPEPDITDEPTPEGPNLPEPAEAAEPEGTPPPADTPPPPEMPVPVPDAPPPDPAPSM